MLQPFEKFKPGYIPRLLELNKRYIVSQTYTRGHDHFSETQKTGILFTDYANPGLAKTHLNAIKHDRFAYLLDLANETHVKKISEMLLPNSPYAVYWSIVRSPKELKRRVDLRYTDQVRRYIMANTDWHIAAAESIRPSLQVIFGELFIVLRRGRTHELRIKFEDVEKS
ncbi:MAG TPA: hypothetical protein VEZ17_04715 [Chitinophagaceae bacterium]|jgi:hypothetical protein|nr:hypothetical protein [Chitinophagaceae bacterium]